jgi:hypothetical protein
MGTLVFLCSLDGDFMTGQAIVVDGAACFIKNDQKAG